MLQLVISGAWLLRVLRWGRQVGEIPSSAERGDQLYRRHHLFDLLGCQRLTIGEKCRLSCNDIEIWINARLIPPHLEIERFLSVLHSFLLSLDLLRIEAHGG